MTAGRGEDGRLARGDRTRRSITARAVEVASIEGLEGLSIGRLARALGVSKSGLFAHFGSKQELQLAALRAASEIFEEHVVRPALAVPPGLGRLRRLCEARLAYGERRTFPGGCFHFSVAAEVDARPGPLRDAVAAARRDWMELLTRTIEEAQQLGELTGGQPAGGPGDATDGANARHAPYGAGTPTRTGTDARTGASADAVQLAFEIDAVTMAANLSCLLHDDAAAYDRARTAIGNRLDALALMPAAAAR